MANSLYKVQPGQTVTPLATDINQYADMLNGVFDVGQITLAPQIGAPSITGVSAAAASGTGLGIGTYLYKLTYVTGYKKSDNTLIYSTETNGSVTISVTTTSGNQKVNLSGLPTSWPSTAIALRVYRTVAGGADGTQKLVTTIITPTSTYNDSTADGASGMAIPTTNTTGTTIPVSNVTGILSIANGGTGSSTQNFVDLTTVQTIGGNKTFTGDLSHNSTQAFIVGGGNGGFRFASDVTGVYIQSVNQARTGNGGPLWLTGYGGAAVAVKTGGGNTLDDGAGRATFTGEVSVQSPQSGVANYTPKITLRSWNGSAPAGAHFASNGATGGWYVSNYADNVATFSVDDNGNASLAGGLTFPVGKGVAFGGGAFIQSTGTQIAQIGSTSGFYWANNANNTQTMTLSNTGDLTVSGNLGVNGIPTFSNGANLFTNTGNAGIRLYETTTAGNAKHLRVSGNVFNIINKAYTASIFDVNDSGDTTVYGALTINGSGGSFANSKAANGYQKLPGGVIFQWCVVSAVANGTTNFNWPITFPTAFYVATATATDTSSAYELSIEGPTTSAATVRNHSGASQNVYIFAVGS
ncbi:hypothetical protein O9H85_08110 [Paenibacillus filicis]|uniref:Putative tail fiber protein gp53-like C-terminal domain-containing protein n=1 Tax=Paenibacillus gyeongsangnamensis TaxID=3388067 RepID=A0ABT4Q697_9BACL|nr:hypothetical protein [Paenibacillus filicis]MCZ8512396.1 hypothetical protein [Paenibacillus filicis]